MITQTLSFPSNAIPIKHAPPTPEPTATPVITPPAPVQVTYPPATAEPTWISQAEGIADSLKWILAAVAGALAILLLIGAVRRAISKSQSNKAMDHLDGGLYRDYSATPKRGRRNEIRSGTDEDKPQEVAETAAAPEETPAPAEEKADIPDEAAPMAETLRRLYSEKKEDAEQAAEAAVKTVEEAADDVKEAAAEAAEDAGEALKDAADTAVQTAEAAHRRRAKKG